MNDFLMWAGGLIATGVFGIIGWVLKLVFQMMGEQRKDLNSLSKRLSDHKIHAAEKFATKSDVDKGFDRVMRKLENIDDKLDRKADK